MTNCSYLDCKVVCIKHFFVSVVCARLPEIMNGKNNYTTGRIDNYPHLGEFNITNYMCDRHYYLDGDNRQICHHSISSNWLGTPPECKAGNHIIEFQQPFTLDIK